MRHAHCFRHSLCGRCDAYDHVGGHKGHVGNELADVLAKAAAQHAAASCGLFQHAQSYATGSVPGPLSYRGPAMLYSKQLVTLHCPPPTLPILAMILIMGGSPPPSCWSPFFLKELSPVRPLLTVCRLGAPRPPLRLLVFSA